MAVIDDRLLELRRLERDIQVREARLHDGDGDGTSGGVTDDWKASVDRQLGQLHGDVRTLLRLGAGATVGLAALLGGLYVRTDGKFETVSDRIGRIEIQQQRLDGKLDVANAKLDTLLERTGTTRK